MKKILTLIAFIAVSFAANADPKDYPPTAFQLAQIVHYVKNEALVKRALYSSYDRAALKDATHADTKLAPHLSGFLTGSEALIAAHISNPLAADEADWEQFYNAVILDVKTYPRGEGLVESFEENTKPVILKAIMLEQAALQKGEIILWRGGRKTVKKDKSGTGYKSFSLGLFSGFLFDGFKYHNNGLITGCGSACTYTYLSGFSYVKRLIGEAESGAFYRRVRETFPEFFEAKKDEWPDLYNENLSLVNLLTSIERYYILDLKKDQNDFYPVYNPLNNMRRLFMGSFGSTRDIKEIPDFHLYGMAITHDELASRRAASKADAYNNSSRSATEKRGEFVLAEHAIYGKGELFHPKEKIPDDAEIVHLYDYPAVDTGGAAAAAVTDNNDD